MPYPIKHILFADDDEDDVYFLQTAVQHFCPDISFTVFNNGNVLMKELPKVPKPDFIILDVNMPCVSGRECLEYIRSKEELKKVPVMVYSTSNNKKEIQEFLSLGADYYVVKPTDFDHVTKLGEEICLGVIRSFASV